MFALSEMFAAIGALVVVLIVGGVLLRGRSTYVRGTSMVLKSFRISEDPSEPAIEIIGRASGIVSWVLNLLQLEPGIEFIVTENEISFRSASLSGIHHTYIPLTKVTESNCGFQRSLLALILTVLFGLGFVFNLLRGLFGSRYELSESTSIAVLLLLFAGVSALVYFLSKRIGLSVITERSHGVVFKRSVIGNVSVDLPEALKAIEVINARILAAQTIKTVSVSPASPPRPAAMAAAATLPGQCARCGSMNPTGARFCENCGSALTS